jgi:hypothetical protein
MKCADDDWFSPPSLIVVELYRHSPATPETKAEGFRSRRILRSALSEIQLDALLVSPLFDVVTSSFGFVLEPTLSFFGKVVQCVLESSKGLVARKRPAHRVTGSFVVDLIYEISHDLKGFVGWDLFDGYIAVQVNVRVTCRIFFLSRQFAESAEYFASRVNIIFHPLGCIVELAFFDGHFSFLTVSEDPSRLFIKPAPPLIASE